MPDKKRKFETKVHRKTLNPFFNETFGFKNVSNFLMFIKILLARLLTIELRPTMYTYAHSLLLVGTLQRDFR